MEKYLKETSLVQQFKVCFTGNTVEKYLLFMKKILKFISQTLYKCLELMYIFSQNLNIHLFMCINTSAYIVLIYLYVFITVSATVFIRNSQNSIVKKN